MKTHAMVPAGQRDPSVLPSMRSLTFIAPVVGFALDRALPIVVDRDNDI